MGWLYPLVGTLTGLILLGLAYGFVVRPWHLTWGRPTTKCGVRCRATIW